jgi:hypothetical protein
MGRTLLKILLFLVILPFVLVMPPLAFAMFAFIAYFYCLTCVDQT